MQVASTLWPSRKSQKISEYRFRLKWTKCSPRTEAEQVKAGQPQRGSDKEAQTSPTPAVGGGWRPTRPKGPTASTLPRGASLLLLQVGLGCCDRWLPPINTRGGREQDTHTSHFTHLSCIPCIVFRLIGVQEKSRSHRVAGVARESGMGSFLALL